MAIWNKIMSALAGQPSSENLDALERCTKIVDECLGRYVEAGQALAEIRDRQLYRWSHESFADFIQARWKISVEHANRIINASNVAKNLAPTGSIPRTERMARQLVSLSPEDQVAAWTEAQQLAADDPVRPPHVAAAVARRSTKKKSKAAKKQKPIRLKVPSGIVIIEPGRGFTTIEHALRDALRVLDEKHHLRAA